MSFDEMVECIGCGASVPDVEYPAFRPEKYPGATSPGCWMIYSEEVLIREYSEWNYPAVHRLTVDTYGAQHPSEQTPQAARSLVTHLVGMNLMLNKDVPADEVTRKLDRLDNHYSEEFEWIEPPAKRGEITIVNVATAADLEDHTECVRRWASAVWEAWERHHSTIEVWTQRAMEPFD